MRIPELRRVTAPGEPIRSRLSHSATGEAGMTEFRNARRSLTSVLTPIEKRVLLWMAVRLPRRVNSDHLTGLALTAMLLAGLSYWLARITNVGLVLAVAGLAINLFGDSLDGTLARVRRH